MPHFNFSVYQVRMPASPLDVKALLHAALSREEWAELAIAESERGFRFMASAGTIRRVCSVLKLPAPVGVEAAKEAADDPSPTVVGFEPPRTEVEAPMHVARLRHVFVEPMRKIPLDLNAEEVREMWARQRGIAKSFRLLMTKEQPAAPAEPVDAGRT